MSGVALTTPSKYTIPSLDDCVKKTHGKIKGVHEAYLNAPPLDADELDQLVDSVKRYDLLKPMLVDGDRRLLDGRSRVLACSVAGVSIREDQIISTDEAPEAIAESNFARRHLTKNQRVTFAVDVLSKYREEASRLPV